MDYIETLEQIKNWACSLIILQYRQAPNNRALIKMLVDLLFANNLILQVRDLCLNVEKSEGAQLEVVGKWVGISKYYTEEETWNHPYTALVNYSNIRDDNYYNVQGGFSDYASNSPYYIGLNNGGFLMYEDWQESRLKINEIEDEYFRFLIKLKIINNHIAYTNKNIDDAIWKWGQGLVYTTWQPMEVTYNYYGSSILDSNGQEISIKKLMNYAVLKGILLAPTGCAIKIKEL